MRLADKLLLCAAAVYAAAEICPSLRGINTAAIAWKNNPFVYIFAGLALIEYIKLLIPVVRRLRRRGGKENRISDGGTPERE